MSKVRWSESDLTAIEGEAIAWVQKLVSEEATAADVKASADWRAQSEEHEAAFIATKQDWDRARVVARSVGTGEADIYAEMDAFRMRRKSLNRRALLAGGMATIVGAGTIYGALRPPFGLWPSLAELNADYHTKTGEQQKVTFAGDVAINLNTQTSLAIRPPEGENNRIELIGGEASFALPARSDRGLSVLAADGRSISNGGKFDVRYTPDSKQPLVNVTCFDGRVRIETHLEAVDLGPRESVRYSALGLTRVTVVDPEIASEWQRGIIEFRATPLAEAVEEINRYRPGRIVLRNEALGRQPVGGRFRIDQMEMLLRQIELTFNAKLQRFPGGLVFLS
ncbi:FecR family protein [Bradyrhizobium cenepequi]